MSVLVKTPSAYRKLVTDIVRYYQGARRAVAETYWRTGRRIVEVEQDGAVRARYGEKLLERLSEDLSTRLGSGFSVRNLRNMRRLYLASPKRQAPAELAWTRQVELLPVRTAKLRTRLERRAVREGLTSRQIRSLVRAKYRPVGKLKQSARAGDRTPLTPIKGKVGIYRIVEDGGNLHWDRGFNSFVELSAARARSLKEGDFVKVRSSGGLEKFPDGKVSDLYTYEADLIRVIDADTFWLKVWFLRPEWRREKLRLRGIDAPELNTPEGQAAKRFVEALFRKAEKITVTTTKPDKFHRYLSDVYLQMPDGKEIFLNNALLEAGHAVRMGRIPQTDWDKE